MLYSNELFICEIYYSQAETYILKGLVYIYVHVVPELKVGFENVIEVHSM